MGQEKKVRKYEQLNGLHVTDGVWDEETQHLTDVGISQVKHGEKTKIIKSDKPLDKMFPDRFRRYRSEERDADKAEVKIRKRETEASKADSETKEDDKTEKVSKKDKKAKRGKKRLKKKKSKV